MKRYPTPPASAVAIDLEVPFHDVDGLRVVWHGHYCKYLELGRTALLRACRLDVADLRELGYRFMVSETHLRHVAALRYGERFRVSSWLDGFENTIAIAYDLWSLDAGARCAQGRTVMVTTREDGELCYETPPALLKRLLAQSGGEGVRP